MNASAQKAMILAAGLGTRMRPLTDHLPKPLIEVAGKPLIDWSIDILKHEAIHDIIVNSFYLAEKLEAHLAAHHPTIRVSREEELLETGGGIKKALPLLGKELFFAFNSDTIAIADKDSYLKRMAEFWNPEKMNALLLLTARETAIGYHGKGDFFLSEDGAVRRRGTDETAPYVFTGVQMLSSRLFEGAPDGPFSMNLLYNRDISRIRGILHHGPWLHIGDPAARDAAESFLQTL